MTRRAADRTSLDLRRSPYRVTPLSRSGVTTIHQGFLSAIRETPDDDAPRLVYADWLDDQGLHERAEFIRVQIELASPDLHAERAFDLRLREQELLDAHAVEWRGRYRESHKPVFTRGFVSSLSISAAELAKCGRRLLGDAPVERANLTSFPEGDASLAGRLAAREFLAQLRTLDFYSAGLGAKYAEVLFASPHLARLQTLYLGEGDTTPEMVGVLGEHLKELRHLYLWDFHFGELGDEGLTSLANTDAFSELRTLDLLNTGVSAAGARAVAESPCLHRLEHLSFGVQACGYAPNRIGVEGVRAIARAAQFARLKHFGIGMTATGDDGVRELAASPYLWRLTSLSLPLLGLTAGGVSALADSPVLDGVQSLDLSTNQIGDDGVEAIANSSHVCNVRTLWLWNAGVGAHGILALAESPSLANLRSLGLGGNVVDTRAVEAILGDNNFARLAHLSLGGCRLADSDRARLQERFGARVKV